MNDTNRIVIPLDGSPVAEKALPFGVALARLCNRELLLLRLVVQPQAHLDQNLELLDDAKIYLQRVKRDLTNPELKNRVDPDKIKTLALLRQTEKELVPIIESLEPAYLVITTHGRNGLKRLVMGSGAREIIEHSTTPTLVIRPGEIKNSALPLELMLEKVSLPTPEDNFSCEILVGLDGTPESEKVLGPATDLALELGAKLVLLQVVSPLPPFSGEPYYYGVGEMADLEIFKERAHEYLKRVQEGLRQEGVNSQIKVRVGDPATELELYARERGVAIIAMASHTHSRVGRLLLGSVAEKVMDDTHLPVLLVRSGYKAGKGEPAPQPEPLKAHK